jgi:hypothetical protein
MKSSRPRWPKQYRLQDVFQGEAGILPVFLPYIQNQFIELGRFLYNKAVFPGIPGIKDLKQS